MTLLLLCARKPSSRKCNEGIAAIKQSLASNQAALRPYTWASETQVLYKGEVKKTKVFTCSYGPDGKVLKTPVGSPAPEKKKRGLRGEIAEKKVDDMEEYMDRAEALIHNYVPPSQERMQAAFRPAMRPSASERPEGSRCC